MHLSAQSKQNKSLSILNFIVDEWDLLILIIVSSAALIGKYVGLFDMTTKVDIMLVIIVFLAVRVIKNQAEMLLSLKKNSQVIFNAINSVSYNNIHFVEACSGSGFYINLLAALLKAQKHVDLTNFDYNVPAHYNIKEMIDYFNSSYKIIKDRPDIQFRRIIIVPNPEKFEWMIEILENLRDCPNYNMVLVGSESHLQYMNPLSVQIVDATEMVIVDPTSGFDPSPGKGNMLWVKGDVMVSVFQKYYDAHWNNGIKIKIGATIYEKAIDELYTNLIDKYPKNIILSNLSERISRLSNKA
jgi:hypothetical protein